MRITPDDRNRVNAAIAAAESGNGADFVCVLMRGASSYKFHPLAWATALALVTPWLLMAVTEWAFGTILLGQVIVFAAAFAAFSHPALRRHLVPRRNQRAAAHRAATEQFFIRGLAHTPERRGILLFVAHDEHYARILADDGAAQAIGDAQWQEAVDRLVAECRAGRHADGFVAALAHCGRLADAAFPRQEARSNALPDRFYVID